jgi:DNA-binding transcriptional ArsR family regulator
VIDALYAGEVLTATECAELAGTTPSAMSYHLRALERFGIVERAEARGDARQRPWRSAGSALQINLRGTGHGAGAAAAAEVLLETAMTEDRRRLVAQSTGEPVDDTDRAWRQAATYDRGQLLLTPDEARELTRRIQELAKPYWAESRQDPPEGAERTILVISVVREQSGR